MCVFWLQSHHTVTDQNFEPYFIMAKGRRRKIITSCRCEEWDHTTIMADNNHSEATSHVNPQKFKRKNSLAMAGILYVWLTEHTLKVLALVGTITSVVGFVVQFIGFRLMNRSCSVAQIIAIVLVIILRAYVRRNLWGHPHIESIPRNHEMDWLALQIAKDPSFLRSTNATNCNKAGCHDAGTRLYEKRPIQMPNDPKSSEDRDQIISPGGSQEI